MKYEVNFFDSLWEKRLPFFICLRNCCTCVLPFLFSSAFADKIPIIGKVHLTCRFDGPLEEVRAVVRPGTRSVQIFCKFIAISVGFLLAPLCGQLKLNKNTLVIFRK